VDGKFPQPKRIFCVAEQRGYPEINKRPCGDNAVAATSIEQSGKDPQKALLPVATTSTTMWETTKGLSFAAEEKVLLLMFFFSNAFCNYKI
jgi:hypothetical protein